jgi:signal transduction histidine kinase
MNQKKARSKKQAVENIAPKKITKRPLGNTTSKLSLSADSTLKDRTRKLHEVNIALMKEVVERKRLEEDLRERTKKLEEADQRKNEFLAVLAHELRNPLAPIIASVEAMKLRGTNDPEIKRTFDIIGRQAEQMTRLLKDLLDVSKILYEKIELFPERVDMREIIRHAADATSFSLAKRNHTLTLVLPNEPKYLVIDPLRIEQMLTNLIFNAVKYTNPGGKIEVSLSSWENPEDELRITVKDNGVGIVPDMLPKIFDLFVQAEKVVKKTKGGLGIGLFLIRRLAALHGGTITAKSEGVDKGSEFTLHLPIKNNLSPGKEKVAGPVPTENGVRIPKRILVVDDNKDAADSLGKIISHLGRTVEIAYNGKEALRLAKKTPPDMAFIDIAMPEMDGYEVVKTLREDPSLSETKLIALTGFGQKEDKEKALNAGFDLHYVKPITLSTLKEIIGDTAA